MTTLAAARRLCVAPMPAGSATTWCPCHGYRVHGHLDDAAAQVVRCERAPHPASASPRILSVAAEAGLSVADERAALERARASLGTVSA